ncbi:MAG: phosphoribosylglycinamide formyltransferase [Actinobacteria bacterium]|uniref:phosphoribosylglycinamide formyltransferase 1 n=1 Tax=freshwater metagenome TaxID=449393 RepID=A0A6J5ZM49_9ZZZZ|nr:phosphoribosylglycinamide formyltransferase [Actinomycetota bacterium]
MKIAVLVSGRGSNLQALIKNLHGFDVEIVAVASDNDDAPALRHARTANIPTGTFIAESFDDRTARDLAIADWLDENGVELVVLAGYMALLSGPFIERFRDRIVNVHPSLLPSFPGTRAVEQAVAAGVKVFGVTVHLVDEGIDSGPILLQRAVQLDGYSDPTEVHQILQTIEHELLPEGVRLMASGAVTRDPGNPQRLIIGR